MTAHGGSEVDVSRAHIVPVGAGGVIEAVVVVELGGVASSVTHLDTPVVRATITVYLQADEMQQDVHV